MLDWIWRLLIIILLIQISPYGRDTTDPEQGWFGERSGLILYTDNATGVQYVQGGPFGGTTVRINADGSVHCGR